MTCISESVTCSESANIPSFSLPMRSDLSRIGFFILDTMRDITFLAVLFIGLLSPEAAAALSAVENADSLTDILTADTLERHEIRNPYRFRPVELIIPGVMIGVGIVGLESDWLQETDHETKDELQEHSHFRIGVDDFSQYAPLAAAYGLRLCGIKGLHDYVDLTIISGTAYLLTSLSVYGVKTITRVERPDGSTRNSFPSGHTATAFAGAEILRREYWKVSPWIGVAGYAVAAGTGFLRMYNNRHWLTDVVAGAGFGILSAQAAYWLYPVITKTFFHKRHDANIYLSPYITPESKGLALQLTF